MQEYFEEVTQKYNAYINKINPSDLFEFIQYQKKTTDFEGK